MKFNLSINKKDIKTARTKVIGQLTKTTSIKGFRKGKAPANLVEEKIGEKNILENILDRILAPAYSDYIIKNKLKPLTNPKINPISIKPDEDWTFEVEIAQKPTVDLGNYKSYIKTALKKAKTTSKTTSQEPKNQPPQDPELIAIFDAILDNVKIDLPKLLVNEEVDHQLSRLIEQIKKLGLTLEQYLTSMKTTAEKLRADYEKTASDNLKLEFSLQEVITKFKIEVSDKEIDDLITQVGDDETQKRLNTPNERANIRYNLSKQKALTVLKKI